MFQTTKKTIKSKDGFNLYYETYTVGGSLPKIFFVHGAGGDLDAWQYVKDEMLQKGFSSIAMDLRGHGFSSHPRSSKSYSLDNFTEDISEILKAEKIEKIFLTGHSFGATVALHFVTRFPEKLNGAAIISGTICPPSYISSKILATLSKHLINLLAFISLPPINPGHSTYPLGKFHKDYEWFGLIRTILRNSWGSYLLANKSLFELDMEQKLKNISIPTLVMVGEKDSIFPMPISEKIHKQIKNSRFVVLPGANHVVVLNNVKQVSDSLHSFLTEIKF